MSVQAALVQIHVIKEGKRRGMERGYVQERSCTVAGGARTGASKPDNTEVFQNLHVLWAGTVLDHNPVKRSSDLRCQLCMRLPHFADVDELLQLLEGATILQMHHGGLDVASD